MEIMTRIIFFGLPIFTEPLSTKKKKKKDYEETGD